jgi:lysophospholipase L1-like esterase
MKQQTANSKQQTANSKRYYVLLLLSNIITLGCLAIVSIHYDVPRKIILKFSGNYHETYEIKNRLFSEYSERNYKIVMLGDSITEGVAWNELLGITDIANRGISGDTTQGILNRLQDIYKINPQICFIMAGINDIGKGISVDVITQNMERIIINLKNNGITVVVQSTLYVAKNERNWKSINAQVKRLNLWLEDYCTDNKTTFLDLNKILSIDDALNPEYTYDGVHLFGVGYKHWRNQILPIIDGN